MRDQRGDTIVEVLMATVLLSVILAGAYTLSNRATRINQQAFERTQISNYMQEQAEFVRAARDNFESEPTVWNSIVNTRSQASVPALGTACDSSANFANGRANTFYLEPTGSPSPALRMQNGEQLRDGLYTVWAEIEPGNTDRDYYNVHVFGCWESLGDNPNNIGSLILRLESPT